MANKIQQKIWAKNKIKQILNDLEYDADTWWNTLIPDLNASPNKVWSTDSWTDVLKYALALNK